MPRKDDPNRHKDKLIHMVCSKLKGKIKEKDIRAIVNIFFQEFVKELQEGKRVAIGRFGYFTLKKWKGRNHWDMVKKAVVFTEGHYLLRFKMYELFWGYLINNLDIDKTYAEDEVKPVEPKT